MALEQPRGSQDAFDHAEHRLPPTSSGDVRRAAPGGFPAGSSHTGCSGAGRLCFHPDGTWPKGEPQNDVESRVEGSCWQRDASTSRVGWGDARRAGRKRRAGSSGTARDDEANHPPRPWPGGAETAASPPQERSAGASPPKKRDIATVPSRGITAQEVRPSWSPTAPSSVPPHGIGGG